jgi:hypothetical protein
MRAKAKTHGGARMGSMRGEGHHQTYWLPDTIDADLGAQTPVRFWEAYVTPRDLEP